MDNLMNFFFSKKKITELVKKATTVAGMFCGDEPKE